jgi:hypothetical protein
LPQLKSVIRWPLVSEGRGTNFAVTEILGYPSSAVGP